ncbi:MAG TPA: mechanosensitive ion channel family protein [Steroidobacteraceae bacterium]|nr:mechanosensitive ion channel family protein [Steroidobacteraceae bacterium]
MNEPLASIGQVKSRLLDLAIQFGPKVLVAAVILVAGVSASRWVSRWLGRRLTRMDLEPPLRELLARVAAVLTFSLFGILALQNLGVQLLPLIAGLSVIGAGLALATQGVLSNVVAGLSILFSKPFRVGEYISIVAEEGQVDRITLFSTTLVHLDRSHVVIPNRKIVGEILHNFGAIRQIDLTVGVSYDTDLGAAVALINEVLRGNARILQEPPPIVQAASLDDWAVKIAVRPWVSVRDYLAATGEINRALLESLHRHGVVIAVPQREVRLLGR